MITADRFPAPARLHMAVAVRDLDRSIAFYEQLLGRGPTKVRPGYARFESDAPALNLALNERPVAPVLPPPNHFGIEVKTPEAVAETRTRLERAGLAVRVEPDTVCCHARQDKVWTTDPDGRAWEIYVVLDDAPEPAAADPGACCADDCCVEATRAGSA